MESMEGIIEEVSTGEKRRECEYVQKHILRKLLLKFLERATDKNATPEELAALPGVARVLNETFTY